jgi:protein-disulfide isomerase
MENKQYLTPLAIVVAGLLIGGALYFRPATTAPAGNQQAKADLTKLAPVKADENVRGNANAPLKIVEFSDLECPFCKAFHLAMEKLFDKYGASGKVAWVYRHFPLDKGARPLHPKAGPEAIAAQCVGKLAGNDAFWSYIDRVFEVTPSNNGLDLNLLPQFAADLKVDQAAFTKCTTENEVKSIVCSPNIILLRISTKQRPVNLLPSVP